MLTNIDLYIDLTTRKNLPERQKTKFEQIGT